MDPNDRQPDDSSIKPVSSLRSQFENLSTSKPARPSSSFINPARSNAFNLGHSNETAAEGSIEVPSSKAPEDPSLATSTETLDILRTKRRPPSPPKPRRPTSTIQHPSSRATPQVNITSPKSPPKPLSLPKNIPEQHGSLNPADFGPDIPHKQRNSHSQIRHKPSGSRNATPGTSSLQALDDAASYPLRDSSLKYYESGKVLKAPPPVNREAKPVRGKEIIDKPKEAPPALATRSQDRKISPFNTPPSSTESSPRESPPPLPIHSKPKLPSAEVPNEVIRRTEEISEDIPPGLPPRRNIIPSRSQDTLAGIGSKRSALTQGFSNKPRAGAASQVYEQARPRSFRNLTPPPRLSNDSRALSQSSRNISVIPGLDYDERTPAADVPALNISEYPDSSKANRRLPFYSDIPRSISTGYEPRLLDMCGEYVCTTGVTTRVWSLVTGKLLLSITHGEAVKITALCFRPTRKIDQEGTRIWLGTNWGEILEIDVLSKKIVASDSDAHNRHEVVRIHRCGTDIWTLDSEGTLFIWPSDESGSPSLNDSINNGRLGRRPTCSLVVGEELWLAFGKEIKIYKPDRRLDNAQLMNLQSISHPAAGDVTCGCSLSDKVYFGHSDGKISIYSKESYNFVELVGVSIYKITSLVGLNRYLWAGHATGIMFVYDTSTMPWKIKKDWRAHSGPVVGISFDRTNIWRMDRLMAVSLGVDNILNTWDGLLEDDWLDDDMQEHDTEYCSFSDITSLILTWNTGASKPTDLRYDEENSNFFRELIQANAAPDVIVFGLQELVDLEDKTLTAKTFFKSRQKDSYGQDHLSSVYRAWRDYLSRCLDDAMPVDEQYTLLHTASLVGLFSCVFVKSSEMGRIRDVQAVEIKTGMGGLHGNKGAIAVRCIMDDSSLCFVNCHLAAGQSKTMDRNNDVASILESSMLPPTGSLPGVFVGGGDGSMILDSEICILSGDLNYRIDTMSRETVISTLKAGNLQKILDRDQLSLSRRKNPGFRLRAFQEFPITFHPTYKYDVGTDTYDTSEKRRAPAWCDRILYRGRVEQLDYQRHEVRVSDHRPVSANFKLRIKSVSKSKREDCQKRCIQRFGQFKKTISAESKLEYLTSIFGLTRQEAQMELAAIREKRDM